MSGSGCLLPQVGWEIWAPFPKRIHPPFAVSKKKFQPSPTHPTEIGVGSLHSKNSGQMPLTCDIGVINMLRAQRLSHGDNFDFFPENLPQEQ